MSAPTAVAKKLVRNASPWKVYPAFRQAFVLLPHRFCLDEPGGYAAPICTDCGALSPRDGMHLCGRCRR